MQETSEVVEYDRKRNKVVLECWGIIIAVLIASYVLEFIKGNRDIAYVSKFILVLLLPFSLTLVYSKGYDYKNLGIRYLVSISYLIFYFYTMLTTVSDNSFIYIFPIVSVLVVYMDKRLILIDYSVALAINLFIIITKTVVIGVSSLEIVMYEQQIACIVLCAIFLYKTCDVLTYSHKYMLKLDKEIDTDVLTSVKNRHYLSKIIKEPFDRGTNISLAVIDIDNFKAFNDTYGHNFGDLVLRRLSKVLIEHLSDLDDYHIVRTGGDEFLIVAINVNEIDLYNLCVKICEDTSRLILKYNNEVVRINISIGVSNSLDDSCYTYKDLYDEADAQLYVAKNNGKNSVVHKERLGVRKV